MHGWLRSPKAIVLTPLLLTLVFIIACGGASATAVPVATTAVQQVAPTTAAVTAPQPTTAAVTRAQATAGVPAVLVVATPTPRPAAPAAVVRAGKYGGFINMQQYAGVRQRLIHQSSITNMNLSPMMNTMVMSDAETDDQTDLVCDLCSSWELAEDGVTYTFHINKDAHWRDGVPVTARDIVFQMESMVNPDQYPILEGRSTSSTVNAEIYYASGNAREIDDKTVEIVTRFPSGAFLPAISIETSMVQAAHTVLDQGITQGAVDMAALNSSGAFWFVEEIKDVSVEYERNPDYWKPGWPFIDGMKHFVITDAGRAIAAYKTGQILTTSWITNMTPKEAAKLDEEMDNLTVHWGGPTGYLAVHMNTTKAPFDDWRVRQAVILALHRQPIIQTTSGGSDAMGYNIPEGFWFSRTAEEYANIPGYRELNGEKHPDDIAAAFALLEEAGIPAGSGTKIQLTARNCCGYPDQAVQVKQQFKELFGWDIELRVMEASAGFDAYWSGDFEFIVQAGGINYNDPDALWTRFVRGTLPQWVGGGRGKFWALDGVEDLFEEQKVLLDLEARKAITLQIGDIANTQGSASAVVYWTMRDWPVEHRIQNFHFAWTNKKWEHVWCDPAC